MRPVSAVPDAKPLSPEPAASSESWHAEFDQVVEPVRGLGIDYREFWRYRELLYFLTLRDIKVRYKQTAFGVAWAVLQPVLAMVLFTVVFSHVAKISSGGVPYPIFAYSALVPWFFFANAVQLASMSLTINPTLITKIYFPRLFLVMAPILAGFVDFLLAMVVLIGMMVYYGVTPNAVGTVLLVPLMLLAFVTTVGTCSWLSALNVKYRDIRFVVPFLIQVWLFATPIVYSIGALGQPWKTIYGINPLAAVTTGFRWALAGGPAPSAGTVGLSVASGVVLVVIGLVYFQRTEKTFADVI
jgi:lipopolysaccharide transport system permease protein